MDAQRQGSLTAPVPLCPSDRPAGMRVVRVPDCGSLSIQSSSANQRTYSTLAVQNQAQDILVLQKDVDASATTATVVLGPFAATVDRVKVVEFRSY